MKSKGDCLIKISNSAKYVISVSAAVALLAGCTGSGGSQFAPTGGMTSNGAHQTMGGNRKVDLPMTLVTPKSVKPFLHKVPSAKLIKPNCCALQKTVLFSDAFGGSHLQKQNSLRPADRIGRQPQQGRLNRARHIS